MSILISGGDTPRIGPTPDIREMAQEQRREALAEKINEVTKGVRADDVVVVSLQRVASIINQPDAPRPFKLSVIGMLAGIIIEASR
jgi:hypothetical protein